MDKVLFIGCLFPEKQLAVIIADSKNAIQFAADKLQKNILAGLEQNINKKIDIINLKAIGAFPINYKTPFVKKDYFDFSPLSKENLDIGFFNIMVLQRYIKPYLMRKAVKAYIERNINDNINIIIYAALGYNFIFFEKLKKRYNNIKVTIIVPDLPRFMMLSCHNKRHRVKSDKTNEAFIKSVEYIDNYVLLTKEMANYLKIDDSRYTVMEGIATIPKQFTPYAEQNERVISYTGTLTKKYGVMNLVKAFCSLDNPKYRLYIAGDGEAKEDIKAIAEKDGRVKYLGNIGENDLRELQIKTCLLVNPRENNEEYTKYSFPSKNLEYLGAGRPVVCYRLDGFPEGYDNYFEYVTGSGCDELANALDNICRLSVVDINKIGERNYNFVVLNKNAKEQTKKICSLCKLQ